MEKTIGYVRVGPGEHARGAFSVETQAEQLQTYCARQDLDLMMVMRDKGVSSAKPLAARLGGRDLLRVVATAGVRHVVTPRLDRLFRSAVDAWRQIQAWDEAGVTLHVVDMGGQAVNTGAEAGRLVLAVMAGFADLERHLTSERTRTALAHKKAHRFVYGSTPYGFDLAGNQLVPHPAEQAVIATVKAWRTDGWSLRRIAGELNRRGIPTKQSSPAGPTTRWYASTVRYLLTNPLHQTR